MKLSLIVPCYNEEEALPTFHAALCEVLAGLPDYEAEILYIDDGSKDKTLSVITGFAESDARVKYISFSRNFGKESAMYAGFCNATGDYVAVMDADMQDPPSLLPSMLLKLESGEYDSVATRRVSRKGEPRIRSFFARLFYKIMRRISKTEVVDGARDFRLMRREMVDAIVSMCEYNRFSKGIFGWVGFRTYWMPYENVERVAGKTKWSFFGLMRYSFEGFINFSSAPLKLAAASGLFFTFVSVLAMLFVFLRAMFWGGAVDGWPSLVCIVLFIGGIQLFCMGIMGQYIARIYSESKHRPHYVVAKTNKDDVVRK